MAGEKTEKATPKKRGEARNKGQVSKSMEINTVVVVGACFGVIALSARSMLDRLEGIVHRGLAQSGDPTLMTDGGLAHVGSWAMTEMAKFLAPVLLAAVVGGVAASVAQVRFKITPQALKPTFSKINPLQGMKRLVGKDMLLETLKSVVKTGAIAIAAFLALWPRLPELAALVGLPAGALLAELAGMIADVALRVLPVYLLIAAADWFIQRQRFEKQIKMSKDDVKQEGRQTDVAPEIKSAIRRRQFEAAKRRMLAEVPSADVVVVNPTHFAVALRYDGSKPAPEVVAKGVDLVAKAIREAAAEAEVPVVSNPPLARALYREVDLGRPIPEELFAAVAEVLAFVFRTARGRRQRERRRRALSAAGAVGR